MSSAQKQTTATWALIVTLATLIIGAAITYGTRAAEIDDIKTGLNEVRKTAQEAKDEASDIRGDIKAIRAILEAQARNKP